MQLEIINQVIGELQEAGKTVPKYVVDKPLTWISRLYVANQLDKETDKERVYTIMHDVYEEKNFRYSKDVHGAYEAYIEEKVKFLLKLAKLSINVGQPPEKSVPYIDEALLMLDGSESVHPYINPNKVKSLRDEVSGMINN
ncbi:MAG: hypothetical protein ATN33_00650 [Epulopiscium sp. Nele67-Bin001]|nr:MAG: hypothetical protein ATN33_00650 [Epulopiscium sp. Nele67-Bin001]